MPRRCGLWYDRDVGARASLGIHVDLLRARVEPTDEMVIL